jgi:hypothetical protein
MTGKANQGDRSGADPERPGDGREALAGVSAASLEPERAGAEGAMDMCTQLLT